MSIWNSYLVRHEVEHESNNPENLQGCLNEVFGF